MPRRSSVPTYRLHKQSGQAVVTLPDGLGVRRDVLLGKHGTAKSRQEYARVLAEWEANHRRLPAPKSSAPDLSVNELMLAYWRHVEGYYRHPDGTPTSEVENVRLALRPLKELYGHTGAADFDSLALEAVRSRMIGMGHCRNRVNKDVGRIKRLFTWATARKLVPLAVHQSLQTVEGLRAGRSEARETAPVRPVTEAVVNATIPFMSPRVAAMVQLQLLTGMRPGEVTVMRGIDLDTTGAVWLYRPGSDQGPHGRHKTAHRGQDRIVPIGPRGQEVLRPWLRLNLTEFLFQPREDLAARCAERRRQRRTPLRPSDLRKKRKKRPKRSPGERYRTSSYANSVALACRKAGVPHWHPNQLRHAKATEIRREAGIDAARAVLGHRSPAITETYAELDLGKAAEVMAKLG